MKRILFVGRSNVGKSRTIRLLTGRKLKVGRRPGVTRGFNEIPFGDLIIVDMPGFGFMAGVDKRFQEGIKKSIVKYIEGNKDVSLAVQIIDAGAFSEIAKRWDERGYIPVEIELFSLLKELNLRPILVANKIDKIPGNERDKTLDEICMLLDILPPWKQWLDVIVPFSAKTREGMEDLKRLIRKRFYNS